MKYDPTNPEHRALLGEKLVAAFIDQGYKRRETKPGEEMSLARMLKRDLQVRLYTSVVAGGVRAVGEDAIRVCLVYRARDGKQRGVGSETRINRVGEVQDIVARALQRAAALESRVADLPRCRKCSAPLFTSKAGKEVCADLCWLPKPAGA